MKTTLVITALAFLACLQPAALAAYQSDDLPVLVFEVDDEEGGSSSGPPMVEE